MKKSNRITLLAFMLALTTMFCFVPIPLPVPLGLMILPVLVFAQIEDFKSSAVLSLLLGIINYIAWFTIKAGSIFAPIFQNPLICIVPRLMIGINVYLISSVLNRWFGNKKTVNLAVQSANNDMTTMLESLSQIDGANSLNKLSDSDTATIVLGGQSDIDNTNIDSQAILKTINQNTDDKNIVKTNKVRQIIISTISTAVGVLTNTLLVVAFTLLASKLGWLTNTALTQKFITACFTINFAIEVIVFSVIVPPIVMTLKKLFNNK